jgi:hypothetical protein
MLKVLGEILPEAIAIAFNPLAVIAVILLLIGQRGRPGALSYTSGWVIGLTLLSLIIYSISEVSREPRWGVPRHLPELQILIGIVFLLMAVFQLIKIQKQKQIGPPNYKWLDKLDTVPLLVVFVLAFVMAALNIKNIGLVLSAFASMRDEGLYGLYSLIIFGVFVLFGSLPVIAPVFYNYLKGPVAQGVLKNWRDWLLTNNGLVMGILFLILGIKLLGQGISGL